MGIFFLGRLISGPPRSVLRTIVPTVCGTFHFGRAKEEVRIHVTRKNGSGKSEEASRNVQ